jgi:hypothetical protein
MLRYRAWDDNLHPAAKSLRHTGMTPDMTVGRDEAAMQGYLLDTRRERGAPFATEGLIYRAPGGTP